MNAREIYKPQPCIERVDLSDPAIDLPAEVEKMKVALSRWDYAHKVFQKEGVQITEDRFSHKSSPDGRSTFFIFTRRTDGSSSATLTTTQSGETSEVVIEDPLAIKINSMDGKVVFYKTPGIVNGSIELNNNWRTRSMSPTPLSS